MKKRYNEAAELLNEIPESMFTYELNAKQMSKIYGDTKDEQEKLEICIKEVLAGFKKAILNICLSAKKESFWPVISNL